MVSNSKKKSILNLIRTFGQTSEEVNDFLKIMIKKGKGEMVADALSDAVNEGIFLPERVFDILISISPKLKFEESLYSRNNKSINDIIDTDNEVTQVILARRGYFLEEFFSHPNPLIRLEVAKHGYKIEELLNDPEDMVRFEAAIRKYSDLNLNECNAP